MRLIIDMNLSPAWVPFLREQGFEAIHWTEVGAVDAPDTEIMEWARTNACVVLTHDLDFGILLSHSQDGKPSVIQARTQDVSPSHLGSVVVEVIRTHGAVLERGALLTIDESRSRVRILPI